MKSPILCTKLLTLLLVVPILCALSSSTMAQHTVSGTVVDGDNGEPLITVSILIQGTNRGIATDLEGNYELDVTSPDAVLVFSYIGYEPLTVPVNGRSVIDVELTRSAVTGEEVVVVGYGFQRAEDITGSIVSVSADNFRVSSPKDAASLVKGRIAGLVIQEPSGNPTDGTEIQLRGTTTLTASSSPLVLIDGVPGSLNTVTPEHIESISVLKDGSAAAIYGTRGTNGVILITTRRHEGGNATLNYSGYTDYQQIVNKPRMMTAQEYRQAIQQHNAPFTDFGGDTDWISSVLREPVSHNHSLTFSGGDPRTNYSANLNLRESNGIMKRSNNEDLRGRINVRHSMFEDMLVTDVNVHYRTQTHFNGSRGGGSFNNQVWRQAVIRNPTDRMKDEEGFWQERPGFNYDNPLGLLNEVDGETENRELRLDGTLRYSPIENLSIELLASSSRFSQVRGHAETFRHLSTRVNNLNGWASRNTASSVDNLVELVAKYENTIDVHDFNVLAGYSWQEVTNESFFAQNRNFPTDLFSFNNLGLGVDLQEGLANLGSNKNSRKLIGTFGRVNYDFDRRYSITASVRYEGDSRFGADHQWGLFPAVSAGWRISNEAFMSEIDWLDNLMIRAGYGVTGIAPGASYQSLASFSFGGFFYNDGEWIQGLQPARNPNPDLKWERKDEINLGVDFSLFDDRLSGNIDLYRRDTRDLLFNLSVPVPPFIFGNLLANVGELRNEGLEIALDYDVIRSNELRWIASANYSTNRNELVSLGEGDLRSDQDFINFGGLAESVQLPTHRIEVGGKIGNFFGYKVVDIDADGLWIIENEDGELINYFDISGDDRQVIGNGLPVHNVFLHNRVSYRNFDLSVLVRGAFDFQILNETRLFYANPTQQDFNLMPEAFDDVFGKRILANEWNYVDYYLEDGDYVKIDDITLGYRFNVPQVSLTNARVYLSVKNLHTFTGYSGLDPEVSIGTLGPGHDPRDRFPTTRTFTLGLNLTF